MIGEEFTKARPKALRSACLAWNAIDNSGRYRIKLPDANGSGCSIHLAEDKSELVKDGVGSDSVSESDAESDEAAYEATVAPGVVDMTQHDAEPSGL